MPAFGNMGEIAVAQRRREERPERLRMQSGQAWRGEFVIVSGGGVYWERWGGGRFRRWVRACGTDVQAASEIKPKVKRKKKKE